MRGNMIVLIVTCKEDVPTEMTSSTGICILLYNSDGNLGMHRMQAMKHIRETSNLDLVADPGGLRGPCRRPCKRKISHRNKNVFQ